MTRPNNKGNNNKASETPEKKVTKTTRTTNTVTETTVTSEAKASPTKKRKMTRINKPANSNTTQKATTPAVPPTPPSKPRKGKRFLSAAFNMAAGAGVTLAIKTAVVATMTWAAAPAIATLLISAAAVGAASATYRHVSNKQKAKKTNSIAPTFWSKATRKNFLRSSAFALVGGALALGFQEGIFDNLFGNAPAEAATPPVPVTPEPIVVTPEPVVIPCPETPMDAFTDSIQGTDVTHTVQETLNRAASTNPVVAAQATKDLGFFAFNGFEGVPQNQNLAAELYAQAADAGNLQAQTDLAYMQHEGFGGIVQDKAAAIINASGIDREAALVLAEEWGGVNEAAMAEANAGTFNFDTASILKGAVPSCQ